MPGNWIQTYTGKAFYPLNPAPAMVDPIDIAHALSMLCRYGGHTRTFYSVAEHCVLMSYAVKEENALWALLHDSTEAYMGDMMRPIKNRMPVYRAYEKILMKTICDRFGLARSEPEEVHFADTRILKDERSVLLGPPPRAWDSLEQVTRLGIIVQGWGPQQAEEEYLNRLKSLGVEL